MDAIAIEFLIMSDEDQSKARPFESLENEVRELRAVFEIRMASIASELKRAEARDEWLKEQITQSRRLLRSQSQTLQDIQTAIQQGVRGLY